MIRGIVQDTPMPGSSMRRTESLLGRMQRLTRMLEFTGRVPWDETNQSVPP